MKAPEGTIKMSLIKDLARVRNVTLDIKVHMKFDIMQVMYCYKKTLILAHGIGSLRFVTLTKIDHCIAH